MKSQKCSGQKCLNRSPWTDVLRCYQSTWVYLIHDFDSLPAFACQKKRRNFITLWRPKILVENPWKFPKTCWEKKWLMCNQWLLGFPRDFSGINIWWVQSFGVLWHSRKLEAYAQSRRSQLIVVSCYTRFLAFSVGLLGGDGLAIYWKGLIVNVLSFSSCKELLLQYYPPWSLT